MEVSRGGSVCVSFPSSQGDNCVQVHDLGADELGRFGQLFSFDHVFRPDASQHQVFRHVGKPVVDAVLHGCNGTILAYGQTSSGKTFTMGGPAMDGIVMRDTGVRHDIVSRLSKDACSRRFDEVGEEREALSSENVSLERAESSMDGIVPRALAYMLDEVSKKREAGEDVELKISVIEVYLDRIRDLLDGSRSRSSLHVREDPEEGVWVEGAQEVRLETAHQIHAILRLAQSNRVRAKTKANPSSSRSHCIYMISLETAELCCGKLFMVDLAGSEKATGRGIRMEEAKAINRSLSALAQVINALTQSFPMHVPYRDSTLTRVLQQSLAVERLKHGHLVNANTAVVVCCSPSSYNYEQTVNTLRFASRIKLIPTNGGSRKRHKLAPFEEVQALKRLLREAQTEIRRLKKPQGGGDFEANVPSKIQLQAKAENDVENNPDVPAHEEVDVNESPELYVPTESNPAEGRRALPLEGEENEISLTSSQKTVVVEVVKEAVQAELLKHCPLIRNGAAGEAVTFLGKASSDEWNRLREMESCCQRYHQAVTTKTRLCGELRKQLDVFRKENQSLSSSLNENAEAMKAMSLKLDALKLENKLQGSDLERTKSQEAALKIQLKRHQEAEEEKGQRRRDMDWWHKASNFLLLLKIKELERSLHCSQLFTEDLRGSCISSLLSFQKRDAAQKKSRKISQALERKREQRLQALCRAQEDLLVQLTLAQNKVEKESIKNKLLKAEVVSLREEVTVLKERISADRTEFQEDIEGQLAELRRYRNTIEMLYADRCGLQRANCKLKSRLKAEGIQEQKQLALIARPAEFRLFSLQPVYMASSLLNDFKREDAKPDNADSFEESQLVVCSLQSRSSANRSLEIQIRSGKLKCEGEGRDSHDYAAVAFIVGFVSLSRLVNFIYMVLSINVAFKSAKAEKCLSISAQLELEKQWRKAAERELQEVKLAERIAQRNLAKIMQQHKKMFEQYKRKEKQLKRQMKSAETKQRVHTAKAKCARVETWPKDTGLAKPEVD